MRRLAYLLVAVACFAGAHALRDRSPRPPRVAQRGYVAILGPLRPLVANLMRLRFEARQREGRWIGQVDDAWNVLALDPGSVPDFEQFAFHFVLDAAQAPLTRGEREAFVAAGFEILRTGRRLHPASARLACVEGVLLDTLARRRPDAGWLAGLPAGSSPREHALERFAESLALSAPDSPDRTAIRVDFALAVEDALADPGAPEGVGAAAARGARALLADPGLPQAMRDALRAALRE
jgi:hypothetical protein